MRVSGEFEVIVVGAGPTGLMLAAELALAGVTVGVFERRTDQHVEGSRAGGLLPRSLEVLDQRGAVDRFVDAGSRVAAHGFAGLPLDISDLPTRHNYVLALRQSEFEPILAEWVIHDLDVVVHRGCEVRSFTQDDDGIGITLADGRSFAASFLVACDGGRSIVRGAARLDYAVSEPTRSWIVAEFDTGVEPEPGVRYDSRGLHGINRVGTDGPVRAVLTEPRLRTGNPTVDELRDELVAVFGTHYALRNVSWTSRFTDITRHADAYRDRRVFVAGDAAHIHPPHGGQGLNTGLQDAVNLGWKLARVVSGRSPDALLDTYHAERHPVAQRVIHNTLAQVALTSGGERHAALRDQVSTMLSNETVRHQVAAMLTGLDICYPSADTASHPLVGRRVPDLDLEIDQVRTRMYEHLHQARPVVIDLGGTGSAGAPSEAVGVIEASASAACELPVVGLVDMPAAILVRPDGHVAWAGDPNSDAFLGALASWDRTPPRRPAPPPTTEPPIPPTPLDNGDR